MFTYDEWGNYMFHIQTGQKGMQVLEEAGFKNPSKEEYEKHMSSYRRLKERENEKFQKFLDDFLQLCNKK